MMDFRVKHLGALVVEGLDTWKFVMILLIFHGVGYLAFQGIQMWSYPHPIELFLVCYFSWNPKYQIKNTSNVISWFGLLTPHS